MRVLIVTETFHPSVDGVVTRLMQLVDYLVDKGHEVAVIAPGLGADECRPASGSTPRFTVHHAHAHTLPFYPSRAFSLPWGRNRLLTERVVRDFRPHVIHAVQPILLAQTAVWSAHRRGIPLVASFHTNLAAYVTRYPIWSWSGAFLWQVMRRMHAKAHVNMVTSETMRRELQAHGITRVRVVRKGVDTQAFKPAWFCGKEMPTQAEAPMNAHIGPLKLLFVGRLAAEKDIERLLPVMREGALTGLDVELTIVGDGPVRRRLESAFAGTRTHFTGVLRGKSLVEEFRKHDVFVFPSITETLGLVIAEAMASGLPVLAARSGPTAEQLQDGVTGRMFSHEDELLRHLRWLCTSPGRHWLKEASRAARREAENYSWAAASADVYALYEQAIQVRMAGTPARSKQA